jgi:hypothetical protein
VRVGRVSNSWISEFMRLSHCISVRCTLYRFVAIVNGCGVHLPLVVIRSRYVTVT